MTLKLFQLFILTLFYGFSDSVASECDRLKDLTPEAVQKNLILPAGYVKIEVPWENAFAMGGVLQPFPGAAVVKLPVGSTSISPRDTDNKITTYTSIKGKFLSIPFKMDAGISDKATHFHILSFVKSYKTSLYPFLNSASAAYITLSSCAGDFRTTSQFVGSVKDPTLSSRCRSYSKNGEIFFGTNGCPLKKNKIYYLNIVFANPANGLLSSETTCDNTAGACDLMVDFQTTSTGS